MFPGAEEDGRDGYVHLINEPRAEVLLDRRDSAAEPDITTLGGFRGAFQCLVNATADEVESRAAGHRDRGAGVMGQNDDGHVPRRRE